MLPFALQYEDTTSFKKETQPTKFVLKHIRLGTLSVFEEGLFFPRFIRNWITFEAYLITSPFLTAQILLNIRRFRRRVFLRLR